MGFLFYEDDGPEFRQEHEWAQGFHVADTATEFGNSQLTCKGGQFRLTLRASTF